MPLLKLKKNLMRYHLFHKKSGEISCTFKVNFIFTLLPYGVILIANSIQFQIDSPLHLNTYDIKQPPFTCSNHHINFILTLSNLFGECEEIQSKLYSIVLTLLQ